MPVINCPTAIPVADVTVILVPDVLASLLVVVATTVLDTVPLAMYVKLMLPVTVAGTYHPLAFGSIQSCIKIGVTVLIPDVLVRYTVTVLVPVVAAIPCN